MSTEAKAGTTREPLSDSEQTLRAAAERVLGCWTIVERTGGIMGTEGLRVAIKELTKVCDSYE